MQYILFLSRIMTPDDDMDDDFMQVPEDTRLTQQREDEDTLPDILRQIENTEFDE